MQKQVGATLSVPNSYELVPILFATVHGPRPGQGPGPRVKTLFIFRYSYPSQGGLSAGAVRQQNIMK